MREKYETSSGYQASASKTVNAPLALLYAHWADPALRARWLPQSALTVRTATPNKSLRCAWTDGSRVDVNFYTKGDARSQVTLSHTKLADASAVQQIKHHWKAALQRLTQVIATRPPPRGEPPGNLQARAAWFQRRRSP